MSQYVLVHGAWENRHAWDKVVPYLEEQGHAVLSIDLPGHGENLLPHQEVTLERYSQMVIDTINAFDEKVVLVAHSLAGSVISTVAEAIPQKIERAIYVTAFLLGTNDSVLESMKRDVDGKWLPQVVFSDDGTSARVPEKAIREVGFHDVPEADIPQALKIMAMDQSTEPFVAQVSVTKERFGKVPITYIRCTLDQVLTPAAQDSQIAGWPVEKVHDLEAGHFPALSVPEELAQCLMQ